MFAIIFISNKNPLFLYPRYYKTVGITRKWSNIAQKQEGEICTYDENNNGRQNSLAFVVKKLYYRDTRAGNVSRKNGRIPI